MSIDFPNREDWLRYRAASIRRVKYLVQGVTMNTGATKRKIAAWEMKRLGRLLKRRAKRNRKPEEIANE